MGEILYYKHIEYQNSKGKTKKKKDESSAPVPYVKLIYSDKTKTILSIFRPKGKQNINPLDYLDQYFNTKMAIIFESIYLAKNIIFFKSKRMKFISNHLNQENQFWKLKKVMMKVMVKVIMNMMYLKV